jgi:hypothetical protein
MEHDFGGMVLSLARLNFGGQEWWLVVVSLRR